MKAALLHKYNQRLVLEDVNETLELLRVSDIVDRAVIKYA